jgi:hypothetical protein
VTITRYRKRPVRVDTIQWTGSNEAELIEFTGHRFEPIPVEERAEKPELTAQVYDELHDTWVGVKTGQHIVRGVQGEFYPIAEDVLAETYELVPPDSAATETAASPLREHIYNAMKEKYLDNALDLDQRAPRQQIAALADAAVAAILPTTQLLGVLHRSAHEDVTRVIALYERWAKAGPPPLGTSMSRWWDARLVELHDAILPPDDQPKEQ